VTGANSSLLSTSPPDTSIPPSPTSLYSPAPPTRRSLFLGGGGAGFFFLRLFLFWVLLFFCWGGGLRVGGAGGGVLFLLGGGGGLATGNPARSKCLKSFYLGSPERVNLYVCGERLPGECKPRWTCLRRWGAPLSKNLDMSLNKSRRQGRASR